MARKAKKKSNGPKGARKAPLKKVGGRRLPARTSSARKAKEDDALVRLNKFLADHGVASRRACDVLIESGKVMVDGEPVSQLGTKIDPRVNKIEVDGVLLRPGGERRYYLLNKPSGVVCTNERRETRPRAIDLITDKNKGRIYTVGRLDEESKGLILLTSDGEFAQRVAHPRHGVSKTYRVRIQGKIPDDAVQKLREGVYLSEGRTGGARILVQRRTPKSSTLLVTIREGKNREVRRVFARVGFSVIDLVRTNIGPLDHRGLRPGKWRALSREEVEALLEASDPDAKPATGPRRAAPRARRGGAR